MPDARDRRDALLEAGLALASELSLPIVLQRIVDVAAQVSDARYGALGVLGEGDRLVEFVTTGLSARQFQAMGRVFGNISLAEQRSADESSQDDEAAIVILAAQAGVDIANATLYEEVRSRERRLEALRDITERVLAGGTEAE